MSTLIYFANPIIVEAQDSVSGENLNLRFVTAEIKNVQLPITGTGTIFAHKTSKIGPLVGGQVSKIYINVGDRVQEGDPLFKIHADRYHFAYEETKAHLAMAIARSKDALPTLERAKELFKKGSLSQSRLDKASSAVALIRAEITLAEVNMKQAKKNLDDTVVQAPFAGAITSRFVDEGVYLSTQVPGSSSAIVELQKIDIAVAIIQIPARELENIHVGAPVKLIIDGISNPVDAQVTIINDKIDIATRTAEIRIGLENSDYSIKPGLFVQAEVSPKSRSAIVIPRYSIQGSRDARYVFVLEDGKAVRKIIRTIDVDATIVEVLSGLTGNERILMGPDLPRLKDGLTVGEVSNVAG